MNKKNILIGILIIIAIPIIFLTPSQYGIIEKSDAQTIVSYFGAIIGGLCTLLGVLWTIKYENKAIINYSKCELKNDKENNILFLNIYVENLGNGKAYDVTIKNNDDYLKQNKSDNSQNINFREEKKYTFFYEYKSKEDTLQFINRKLSFTAYFDSIAKCNDTYDFEIEVSSYFKDAK